MFDVDKTYRFRIKPRQWIDDTRPWQDYKMTVTALYDGLVDLDYEITGDSEHEDTIGDTGDTTFETADIRVWIEEGHWTLIDDNDLPEELFEI